MSDELKPCANCGSPATFQSNSEESGLTAICQSSQCRAMMYRARCWVGPERERLETDDELKSALAERWNRRPQSAPQGVRPALQAIVQEACDQENDGYEELRLEFNSKLLIEARKALETHPVQATQAGGREAEDILVSDAKEIAQRRGYDQVVIIGRAVDQREHVTTYGKDADNCRVAAQIGEFLKFKVMNWSPDEQFNNPDHQKAKEAADWLLAVPRSGYTVEGSQNLARAYLALRVAAPAPAQALREALEDVTAHLVAAVSLLENNGSKKGAASNKMFDLMIEDYKASIRVGRAALTPATAIPEQSDEDVARKVAAVWYDTKTDFINEGPLLETASAIIARHVAARTAELQEQFDVAVARVTRLEARNAKLVEVLKECADDLEAYVHAEYPPALLKYPDNQRKFVRDMQPVVNARAALTAHGNGKNDNQQTKEAV